MLQVTSWLDSVQAFPERLESAWPAYLDGERTLTEAAVDLIRALGDAEGDRP